MMPTRTLSPSNLLFRGSWWSNVQIPRRSCGIKIPTSRTERGVTSASVIIQWMGPALLVEVSHEAYAHNLLKVTQIGELPVKVSPHRSMNSRKVVVKFGRAANGMSNEEQGHAICSRGSPSFSKPEQWKKTNRHILPDIPGNFTPTEGQTRIWEVQCWPLHPIPTPVFQVSKEWPQFQDLPGHCRCLPIVLRYRSQTRQLSKQGVLEMFKLQWSTFCYQ